MFPLSLLMTTIKTMLVKSDDENEDDTPSAAPLDITSSESLRNASIFFIESLRLRNFGEVALSFLSLPL